MPKIPGIEKFAGKTMHAIHFNRHQDEFKGKRVLLIGLHASTQDVVLALKNHGAAQVYATHRNGVSLVSFPGTPVSNISPPYPLPSLHQKRNSPTFHY